MRNPYRWNQINLDLIYGRDALLDEILEALPSVNGDSFGITGARRMGKTTLLRAIERDLCAGQEIWRESGTALVPIYIDGLALPRPLTAEFLWGRTFSQMLQAFDEAVEGTHIELDFSEFMDKSFLLLKKQELVPKIVVIFDEIEHIIVNDWSAAYFAHWRALLSNNPKISGYFSAVFSGALEMAVLQHDVGSPLMDVLQWRSLRSLTPDETRRLMTEPSGLTIDDGCAIHAFSETGGHPMIVQYAMQKAFNGAEGEMSDRIRLALANFEVCRSWQFGEWWSKYCDLPGQRVYAALPVDGEYKRVSTFAAELGGYAASKAFEVLQHIGVAELSDDQHQVRRRGAMFSRWQQKNGSVAQGASSFDSGLASLLDRLERGFREKYVSAWTIYGQEMPNYSGAVSEMRDLITQTLHKVAPDAAVEGQPGFKFEKNLTKPTRRQRVMFLFGVENREQGQAVAGDDELLQAHSVQLAGIVSKAYANASALTHTTATRPLAYQAIKQAESILAQLISRYVQRIDGGC
ncbi:MAG: hypothetical protein ABTQ25_17710 [Nitrosomonas ureae]